MINFFSSSRYKINKSVLQEYAEKAVQKYHNFRSSDLNIAFVGKRKMKQLAKEYKDEDVALPVLSFSYMNDPISKSVNLIGEVVICYPQAILLAAERNKKVDVMLKQLIEHGIQNIFTK